MNYEQMMEARRQEILLLVQHLAALKWPRKPFIPGETPIPVTGKVFDGDDVSMLVDSALDFWLTTGRFAERFEKEFAAFMGARFCSLVNSGSSANLLALTALTDPSLKDRALKPGDEVITCACGFPTTLNPILQNRLVPVFLDVSIPTYNLDLTHLEEAVGPRTKAIMVAHTLGNPFDLDVVRDVAERKGLLVIEDCCDAVGSTWRGRQVGTFGDLATVSFYPAHHITMGEGGAVLTSNPYLRKIVESFRDWGRDCWCAPGHDNTCGKRFERQMGSLPFGFDHKYCVPSSCVIETKDGAITAGALAKEFISATFLFGQLQWAWAAIHPSGKKDVWSIRLANGMRLRYGFDHPVLTPSGYVRAKDLMRGDVVAVAGKLPDRPEMVIPDALLSLVGMVIADGVWAPRPHYTHFPIQWYKSDQECRDLFTQCLNDLSIPFSVNSVGYISPLKGILQKKMTDLGLLPLKAAEKRVPTALTGLSSRQSKVLLRALWSGDGCVEIGVNNNVRIVYTSRSLGLVHDIQRLLFQCGILSTITSSSVLYEGERRPYHTISVVGRDSKRVMLDLLESAPRLGGRVATLRTHLESKKERCKGIKNPSLEGDIWWVGITSVTYDGNEDVFDVSVENHEHNFVADGVVTHNTYSRIGYNLKATDMQAAVGCAQLAKLPGFIEKRKANYKFLRHALEPLQDALILPEATLWSEPSWFGFPITLKIDDRPKIIKALEAAKIATRLLFGGNLLHQPAYQDIPHRVVGTLEGADRVMRDTFWVGVYPGLAFPMLAHIANVLLGALS